jgi:hypothetical protein
LQRKVTYEPIFEDINGEFSKAEIRLLYIWRENDERPILLENLGRMTKAAMVNVDFNKKMRSGSEVQMLFLQKDSF